MSGSEAEDIVKRAVRAALADVALNRAPRAVSVVKARDTPPTWLVRVVFGDLDEFGFEVVPDRGSRAELTARVAHQLQHGCGDLNDLDFAESRRVARSMVTRQGLNTSMTLRFGVALTGT